jgi:hypothetical protein
MPLVDTVAIFCTQKKQPPQTTLAHQRFASQSTHLTYIPPHQHPQHPPNIVQFAYLIISPTYTVIVLHDDVALGPGTFNPKKNRSVAKPSNQHTNIRTRSHPYQLVAAFTLVAHTKKSRASAHVFLLSKIPRNHIVLSTDFGISGDDDDVRAPQHPIIQHSHAHYNLTHTPMTPLTHTTTPLLSIHPHLHLLPRSSSTHEHNTNDRAAAGTNTSPNKPSTHTTNQTINSLTRPALHLSLKQLT